MQLPFTAAQFFDVFRQYNDAVWPAQIALVALAATALMLVARPQSWSGRAISGILAFFWMWLGVAYHLMFFAAVNPAAYAFAAVSIVGAAAFVWQGVVKQRLTFTTARSARTVVGFALMAFALVAYPAWSVYAGHQYPAMPTFGLPCPTTLFTVGMLCLLVPPYPRAPLLVPVLWCLVGAQAAFLLGVYQDLGLIIAGVVGVGLIIRSHATPRGV